MFAACSPRVRELRAQDALTLRDHPQRAAPAFTHRRDRLVDPRDAAFVDPFAIGQPQRHDAFDQADVDAPRIGAGPVDRDRHRRKRENPPRLRAAQLVEAVLRDGQPLPAATIAHTGGSTSTTLEPQRTEAMATCGASAPRLVIMPRLSPPHAPRAPRAPGAGPAKLRREQAFVAAHIAACRGDSGCRATRVRGRSPRRRSRRVIRRPRG